MFCTQCGQQVSNHDNFCTHCGAKLVKPVLSAPVQPSTPKPVITPPKAAPEKKFGPLKEKLLLAKLSKLNRSGDNIPPELYQEMRDYEMEWLETHYDFNSIEGIHAIPVVKQPKRPPTSGVTGEVYYYLRKKGYEHEDNGNIDLALACLRKSNALLKCKGLYNPEECYPLVKMLARAGYIEEAYKEKADIDGFCDSLWDKAHKELNSKMVFDSRNDLIIMDAHGSTCPECAKYQGRVYSISGKSRVFPKVPDFFHTCGCVHEGCSHNFWSYIHGVNDPQLEYTLEVHPLQNKAYGKDIVTFSNRPFVDDRTLACQKAAAAYHREEDEKAAKRQYYLDHMIEIEARRGQELRDFHWLEEHLPSKCPKSISGYRRMKTQNTKNYQLLQQAAAELGRKI